jgi:outer membrane lipoprotein-sorting protein
MRAINVLVVAGILLAANFAVAKPLSDQDKADIARVENYVNGITTITGRFLQAAPDGSVSDGRMWLSRPGKLRFEYNPPPELLVVADGIFIIVYDRELSQVDRVPIATTPIAALVNQPFRLSGDVTVTSVKRAPGLLRLTLTAAGPAKENLGEHGELTLVFTDGPLVLRQWEVTDARGGVTKVSLSELEFNQPLLNRLFVFIDPTRPQ